MKGVLNKIHDEIDFELNEIDIESDPEIFEKYKEKIPVLMVDGKIFAKYRVDEENLRKKLTANSK